MRKRLGGAAAILLLLMVCVDLAIPSLCSAETIPQFPPTESEGWRSIPADPVDSPAAPLGEEDCFCCCSHIRPQAIVRVVEELSPLPERKYCVEQHFPDVLPNTFFHPPKN